ncbi:hypothetical protein [Sinorhizobium americanum]|uniref:Uncharacterized protein n=1 Tax=Sinorhizobium americanum TaxID=194963 RepID=A0A4R2BR84_9HYPH|nr:hypothetical protein [Sinorhizobium americanum]TCN30168.1 hypothetical protein EV184_10839 [Sinorhizobium americanum]
MALVNGQAYRIHSNLTKHIHDNKHGMCGREAQGFKKKLRATLEALEAADANRNAIEEVYRGIQELLKPGGGRMPDFDGWLQQQAERCGLGVRDFMANEDLVRQNEENLKDIRNVIQKRADCQSASKIHPLSAWRAEFEDG